MDNHSQSNRRQRRSTYRILILIGLAIVAGRIAAVTSKEGDTAFLSANDRSRWCTVAALVEARTYEIDRLINLKYRSGRQPWRTIDMVRHRGDDGQFHYYSSKPPLFPTLVAGVYWLVYQASGLTLSAYPIYATRIVLACVNLPLLALFYLCTIGAIERLGSGQWSRIFVAAATCFGTMLMPFAVSLNNHLVAAASTALVLYIYVVSAIPSEDSKVENQQTSLWVWLIAGLAAGFAAANELPALSMTALWCLLILWLDFRGSIAFLLGIIIAAAGFFATNMIAHDSLRPPYMHRADGAGIEIIESADTPPSAEQVAEVLIANHITFDSTGELQIGPSGEADRLVVQTVDNQLFALRPIAGDSARWELLRWDDWYDYPGSYWVEGKQKGVDLGEHSREVYLAHATVGHHGILSLTPIWCLVPIGLLTGLFSGPGSIRRLVLAIAVSTAVCLAFYVMQPELNRNYGGVSTCFRWMLWFTPLWLVVIYPVVRWCSLRSVARFLLQVLLACSVFSVAISLETPWQHPWIYRLANYLGWLGG